MPFMQTRMSTGCDTSGAKTDQQIITIGALGTKGSLVCVYYPDYMDGINAAGWHLHFLSDDKKHGGHVFDVSLTQGDASFLSDYQRRDKDSGHSCV